MAKTKTKARTARTPARPVQAPKRREKKSLVPRWAYPLAVAVLLAAVPLGAFLLGKDKATSGGAAPASASASGGLPDTPDYHSLLVAPSDPKHIFLGTHAGLYESRDGGRNWRQAALEGQDAMNLARSDGETVWTAGHNVFAKSTDGGKTWIDVRPEGLPSLDIHGFTVDPHDQTLWAAVAGQGLYRSNDGGRSFDLVSKDVGGAVMALTVASEGRLLAADMQAGLLVSEDGGKQWQVAERAQVMGLATNPEDPRLIVAAGPGILLSTDGGETWEERLPLAEGAGPVAWSESHPTQAYTVGFDRTLYETSDGGRTWNPVS